MRASRQKFREATLTKGRKSRPDVNGTRMAEFPKKITDDPYGAAILIRRLIMEQGAAYWRRYLSAFALMAVSAATTAGSAWLLGQVINQAYVDKNVRGIAILSGITVIIFILKGAATTVTRLFYRRSPTPSSPTTSGRCSQN